jgi:3alpha(or 20beta)-hydroxysteroid dehydrogenase
MEVVEGGRLAGKVAIITGAARGQGAAQARRLASEGASVVVADVRAAEGRATAEAIGPASLFVALDVRSGSEWERCVVACGERFGPPTVLVNNAGVLGRPTPVEDLAESDLRAVLDTNLVGAFLGIGAVVPVMAAGGGGSIVNISSTAGFVGAPGLAAYTASKFGLRGLTKAAALELGCRAIRVNSVHPGSIDTEMLARPPDSPSVLRQAIPRLGTSEEIASLVAFLASDESSYCTGCEFVADGGFLAGVAWSSGPGGPTP